MTFSIPRKLSRLAAKVFVENLLESSLFSSFHHLRDLIGSDLERLVDHVFECRIKENMFEIVEEEVDKMLWTCNDKALESIRQVLRTTDHPYSCGAIVLQFLYDSEINFRRKHWLMFPILLSVQRRYANVEKFVFDSFGEHGGMYFLSQFVQCLPALKVFKGVITKEWKFLSSLRHNCPRLKTLTLCIKEGFFTSNQLSSFFFSGRSLDYVKKAFVKLEDIPLSFPNLENFSMTGVGYEQYDFFKMFLHFYKNVNFYVGLHYSHLYFSSVSWFDAVLSHSVIINPDLCVSQCELNVFDLYLPFCERSLQNWKKLESLLITLGIQGKKTPATTTNIGKRLEGLLAKQDKIKELCIRIQNPINDDEVSEILYPSLKSHGKRFRQLKVLGNVHFLSHRSLVQVVNMCPNVRHLILVGKRIPKYFKDVKLKPLPWLESLTVVWSQVQTNTTFCQWISKLTSDLLKNAANLKFLYCTANLHLMEYMNKMHFGSELEKLIIYFHMENPSDGVAYLSKILPRLPKLEQLVVNESYHEKTSEFEEEDEDELQVRYTAVEPIYDVVKNMVDKTQISMRYYTFEDGQIAMYP